MYKLWVRNTTWIFLVLWFPCFQRNLKNFPNYVTHGNYPFQPKLPVSFSGNFQWRMEQQTRLKKANIILFSMSRSFRIISAIPDNFGRFSNTTAYFRTLLKIRKDCWISENCRRIPRRNPKIFDQEIPSVVSWRLPRWIALNGQKWPCFYAFRKQIPPSQLT